MSKPNEITEQVLLSRLSTAVESLTAKGLEINGALLYAEGGFKEFEGVVKRATEEERRRAAQVCKRLGHGMTAAQILKG